jgi:hypothetical protein
MNLLVLPSLDIVPGVNQEDYIMTVISGYGRFGRLVVDRPRVVCSVAIEEKSSVIVNRYLLCSAPRAL